MLGKCHNCLESCYWHLIEKRFCFDESIALYHEPIKREEKKNNLFDNMAFFDSVSVIAGRAVVTIDPLPQKENAPIVQQPKRLKWQEHVKEENKIENPSFSLMFEKNGGDDGASVSDTKEKMESEKEEDNEEKPKTKLAVKKTVSFERIKRPEDELDYSEATYSSIPSLSEPGAELRKKSLMQRRMSKSLNLKIDFHKELPIIRQSSVPKFFLDTPEDNQTESTLIKYPLTALKSPMVRSDGFTYDLKSVVQLEKNKRQNTREFPLIHRESSRLSLIKEKIKLKKSKSTISTSNIPHSNYI